MSKIIQNSRKQSIQNLKSICFYCGKKNDSLGKLCNVCLSEERDKNPNYFKEDYITKEILTESKVEYLSNLRIPLKNLLYLIGLPLEISKQEILCSQEYLGQYGKIKKIVINRPQKSNNMCSCSAYVTYNSEKEASLAIYALDQFQYQNKILGAFYGTTKYCSYFLKGVNCLNDDCAYLHKLGENHGETKTSEKQKINLNYLSKYIEDYKKLKHKFINTPFPNVNDLIKSIESISEPKKIIKKLEIKKIEQLKPIKKLDIITIEKEIKDIENSKKTKISKRKNESGHSSNADENTNSLPEIIHDHFKLENEENISKLKSESKIRENKNINEVEYMIINSLLRNSFKQNKFSRFSFAKIEKTNKSSDEQINSIQNLMLQWISIPISELREE